MHAFAFHFTFHDSSISFAIETSTQNRIKLKMDIVQGHPDRHSREGGSPENHINTGFPPSRERRKKTLSGFL
jgi:hypothetical protein